MTTESTYRVAAALPRDWVEFVVSEVSSDCREEAVARLAGAVERYVASEVCTAMGGIPPLAAAAMDGCGLPDPEIDYRAIAGALLDATASKQAQSAVLAGRLAG